MTDAILVHISTSHIHRDSSTDSQLGLYYIAEYAHYNNINVKVKRYASNNPIISSIQTLLKEHQCRILGFHIDSENLWTIRRILLNLKNSIPDLFIIIGGPQVTGDAELALKRIPYADCAVIGEGEITFTELVKEIKSDSLNLETIKGIGYIVDGEYRYTGSRKIHKDLDIFPFPRRKNYSLDPDLIFNNISTGRGCVGNCTFCFEGTKKDNSLRLRSTDSVIEEIDYIIENLDGLRCFAFLDDTFIITPQRTETICNHLIDKYDGKIGWFCEARVDILIKNLHLLPLMKRAGLIRIQLGGESGNQRVLDAYNKHMQVEQLITVVKEIYKVGIPSVYINFIIGGALETLETFNDTIELAKHLLDIAPGCAEVGSSLFSPYVGTPIRQQPNNYEITILDSDLLRGPDGQIPTVRTTELTEYKIHQLKSIFNSEIRKKFDNLVTSLTDKQILNLYTLKSLYTLETAWFDKCQTIEEYSNYFESIAWFGFYPLKSLTEKDLQISVPFRTSEPVSDGENFYRVVCKQYIKNSTIEDAVFLLSSGKICFSEIVLILSRSPKFSHITNLEQEIYKIYQQFDDEHLIVWKKDY